MKRYLSRILIAVALVAALPLPAAPAAAYDPFGNLKGGGKACNTGGASETTVCKSTTVDPLTGENGVLRRVTGLVAVFAGAVAVIVIVIAGIRLISSAGDAEKITKSKRAIMFAAIGLVIIALGQIIITFIISRL